MAHDFKQFPELTNSQFELYYFESPHKQITEDFRAKVVKVIDGDTVKLRWDERDFDFPIRLSNIQAPELGDTGGDESKKWLENKLAGEEVDILIDPKNRVEKWGRLLGRIMFSGMDIGEESVNLGFSVPWEQRNDGKIPDFNVEAKVWA
jgi:endonuclease YncB( thermonuclease family)